MIPKRDSRENTPMPDEAVTATISMLTEEQVTAPGERILAAQTLAELGL